METGQTTHESRARTISNADYIYIELIYSLKQVGEGYFE
jgi:hypothetical protein